MNRSRSSWTEKTKIKSKHYFSARSTTYIVEGGMNSNHSCHHTVKFQKNFHGNVSRAVITEDISKITVVSYQHLRFLFNIFFHIFGPIVLNASIHIFITFCYAPNISYFLLDCFFRGILALFRLNFVRYIANSLQTYVESNVTFWNVHN